MINQNDFPTDAELALHALGAESLAGSGFESEIPEADFVLDNDEPEGTGR